jgi:hypothetical protein
MSSRKKASNVRRMRYVYRLPYNLPGLMTSATAHALNVLYVAHGYPEKLPLPDAEGVKRVAEEYLATCERQEGMKKPGEALTNDFPMFRGVFIKTFISAYMRMHALFSTEQGKLLYRRWQAFAESERNEAIYYYAFSSIMQTGFTQLTQEQGIVLAQNGIFG